MAEELKNENQDVEEEGGKKKSKLKLIIIVAVGVLVLGGVGAGAFLFLSGGGASSEHTADNSATTEGHGESAASEEHGKKEPEKKGEAVKKEEGSSEEEAVKEESKESADDESSEFGKTYRFKTFHLNLGNPLENRYIRFEIAVEYKGGDEQKIELDKRLPQLRDAIISVVSRKTREFLLGADGKDELRRELLIKINRYLSRPVEAVFITDILIE